MLLLLIYRREGIIPGDFFVIVLVVSCVGVVRVSVERCARSEEKKKRGTPSSFYM